MDATEVVEYFQNETVLIPVSAHQIGESNPDFTGWSVNLCVKSSFEQENTDALVNSNIPLDANSGEGSLLMNGTVTTNHLPGEYIAQFTAVDAEGNEGKTVNFPWIVKQSTHKGVIS